MSTNNLNSNLKKEATVKTLKVATKMPKKASSGPNTTSSEAILKGKIKLKHLTKKEMIDVLVANPKLATQLEDHHHDYSGQQSTKAARALRKRLRRQGIYLSKLGHHGLNHDKR